METIKVTVQNPSGEIEEQEKLINISIKNNNLNVNIKDDKVDVITKGIVFQQGGTYDHSQLQNLDYENSGHTGFASSSDIEELKEIISNISGGNENVNIEIINTDETLEIKKENNVTTINTNVVVVKNSSFEFPNRGVENALYVDKQHNRLFIWENGEYISLYDTQALNEQIEIIFGGNANG